MSKKTDYSNTIFYKIHCKDTDVKDIYIGHTTNFVQRKFAHKQSCTHAKYCNHNCKVYSIIRQFGGWDNWNMNIIAFHECDDQSSARKLEQQYFEEYNATLNSIQPFPTPKPKVFLQKDITEQNEKRVRDKMEQKEKRVRDKREKPRLKYFCEKCLFTCMNKKDYKRHLLTDKHKIRTELNNFEQNTLCEFICECGKEYNSRSGLWYHKHKCTFQTKRFQENESPPEEIVPPVIEKQDTMIDKLVTSITEIKEDTQEMKKMMMTMINMQSNQKLQTNHSNV